ncbi:hypothetical protein FISHEDRAFT_59569 [Fistulina hepatica ATCC 64428]|uniref:Uncharacterized protein n=1 Tax=Fistulina hepatica ATCC 64428 TaxID=1128425 RepID=A0A0D7AB11_9AGAR|nr:hypothetical protein FISHEDRAFT_59569 [Fistulina hepatica ATCC 64428]
MDDSVGLEDAVQTWTKQPAIYGMSLEVLEEKHGCNNLKDHIQHFINNVLAESGVPRLSNARLRTCNLRFDRVAIYHRFKFIGLNGTTLDAIKARPAREIQPARYDIAVVCVNDGAASTGLDGHRIGHVKAIFALPNRICVQGYWMDAPAQWPRTPLAYVEWYNMDGPHSLHNMYKVDKPHLSSSGCALAAVIELETIWESCMLIPRFHGPVDAEWTSENVLDHCSSFWLNNWQHKCTYSTMW